MKTPEEIKKGLMCGSVFCNIACPYWNDDSCTIKVNEDALAYIQQLEADAKIAEIKMNAAFAKCEQLERERDAAVADLATIHKCEPCKHRTSNSYIPNECFDCVNFCNFEWRGPCEENGGVNDGQESN